MPKPKKIVTLYILPLYNRFLDERQYRMHEKFLVLEDSGKFYKIKSMKNGNESTLGKEYFVEPIKNKKAS